MDIEKYIALRNLDIVKELDKRLKAASNEAKIQDVKNQQYANAFLTGKAKGLQEALDLFSGKVEV